jgi:maltooligosyltrehalose trehalohydrolase
VRAVPPLNSLAAALGARPIDRGVAFRLWAPLARSVDVVYESDRPRVFPLAPDENGYFAGMDPAARSGDVYRYRVNGEGPFPDPASRFQPRGVHGPSQIVDPDSFPWSDGSWRGVPWNRIVFYEIHIGTFTPEGTFEGARRRLPYLRDLGVTAVELMPAADFPGERNWGYDGVQLFAPARCYGTPDDLRRLVDDAHRLGLAVFQDVVYNHLGPDGNYLGVYSPFYFTDKHKSPWGAGVNLDGDHNGPVRSFFIENAQRWIEEYHMDGLRLDATHALIDESPRHFLSELSDRLKNLSGSRPIYLVAEDDRNLNQMVRPVSAGGWGLDALWADDFHHQLRVNLAGDRDGYFADFSGTLPDIAATLRQGWFFRGQHSQHFKGPRGTEPPAPDKCVICLQNHDQVGNRALGDRLHHCVDGASFRAATALLLTAPETPLLFMGQEWGASSPFQYFTDHNDVLGRLVTEGRRGEFQSFRAFAEASSRAQIPDPQAETTFERSRLVWEEQDQPTAAGLILYHKALLALRRRENLSGASQPFRVETPGDDAVVIRRDRVLVAVRLTGKGVVSVPVSAGGWAVILTSESPEYAVDPAPPRCHSSDGSLVVEFFRPGAVIWGRS